MMSVIFSVTVPSISICKGETIGKGFARYRLRTRPLHPARVTFSDAAWQLGPHHFDVLDGEHLVASWAREGVWHLGTVRLANGELEEWNVGWQPIGNVAAGGGRVVMLAGSELVFYPFWRILKGLV